MGTVKLTDITMVAAVFFFFLLPFLVFFVSFYFHRRWEMRSAGRRQRVRRTAASDHFAFAAAAGDPVPSRGLDLSVLLSLPVTVYRTGDFEEALECAVCLTEVADGEEARLLPKCGHGFHLACIDMWLYSHSSCPICRCAVAGGYGCCSPELRALDLEGSTLEGGRLMYVTIPVRSTETFQSSPSLFPLSASQQEDEGKSPVEEAGSPAALKAGSFRRILSRGKRIASPRVCDIEKGMVGSGEANGEGSA